jgi:Zn-dependent peptidase ImmA (M78 family)
VSAVRIGHVRSMARSVLQRYKIAAPPVDVEMIARSEGLEVRLMQTWPASVSGLLLRDSRLLGLNGLHSRNRRRFSLAHELGHWFLRHDLPWHENEISIDDPPKPPGGDGNPIEGEADEFAGELLAPREMLKRALKETRDPRKLAELFEISEEAMWVRLLRHKLL